MALYFLHLRDHAGELLDPEGHECRDLDVVARTVLSSIRSLIAADVLLGVVRLDQRIDAEDAQGRIVHSMSFERAVRFAA